MTTPGAHAFDDSLPEWRQSFSYDAGATWRENWVMTFSRQ